MISWLAGSGGPKSLSFSHIAQSCFDVCDRYYDVPPPAGSDVVVSGEAWETDKEEDRELLTAAAEEAYMKQAQN